MNENALVIIVALLGILGAVIAAVRSRRKDRREALLGTEVVGPVGVIRESLALAPMRLMMLVEVLPGGKGYALGRRLVATRLPKGFEVLQGSSFRLDGREYVRLIVPEWWSRGRSAEFDAENGIVSYAPRDVPLPPPGLVEPAGWWRRRIPRPSRRPVERREDPTTAGFAGPGDQTDEP